MCIIERYNVVLSGSILDGMELVNVKRAFIKTFKIRKEQADKMFVGQEKVLKKNLDHKSAYHYKRVINELGAEVEIKRVKRDLTQGLSCLSLVSAESGGQQQMHSSNDSNCCSCCGVRKESSSVSCSACGVLHPSAHVAPASASVRGTSAQRISASSSYKNVPKSKILTHGGSRTLIFKMFALLCITFGALDFGLYLTGFVDLTGVSWSPFAAWGVGCILNFMAGR